jgi:predicted aldo/keto reductase-like oxidoreductase
VTNAVMRFDGLKEDQRPSACLACGKCAEMCPQKIDIPSEMAALDELMKNVPSWAEICRQREAAQGMK